MRRAGIKYKTRTSYGHLISSFGNTLATQWRAIVSVPGTKGRCSLACLGVYYSRTPIIRTLIIRTSNYPERLGLSAKFVENFTKLTFP